MPGSLPHGSGCSPTHAAPDTFGDQVAVRFDPRRGERDPTFDLGVQYTVTLLHDLQTGRAYLEARFALADVEWPF
jgi:hypothetical protein